MALTSNLCLGVPYIRMYYLAEITFLQLFCANSTVSVVLYNLGRGEGYIGMSQNPAIYVVCDNIEPSLIA